MKRTERAGFCGTFSGKKFFTLWYAALAAAMLFTATFLVIHRTTTDDRTYVLNDAPPRSFEFPLKISSAPAGTLIASFTLTLPSPAPTRFFVLPDDCLESLEVNGKDVSSPILPLCDYGKGGTIDLSGYVHPGQNTIVASVNNAGGDAQLLIEPSWMDPVLLTPIIILLWLLALCIITAMIILRPSPWISQIILLLICAIGLRAFYLLATPYWVRGHDTDGHIEYLDYLADNWALPVPDQGWEFWQPPLYYILGGAWLAAADLVSFDRLSALFGVQVGSLLLSIFSLLCCVWIGWRLFPDQKERARALPLFLLLLGFFPGLIFLSARINNDVLVTALAFLAVALLVEWWKSGKALHWILLMITISVGILTKNTGLLLLPVAFGCLLLRRSETWKRKTALGLAGVMIVTILAGWFTAYRTLQNKNQDLIIGNTSTLHSGLAVPNNLPAFLIFNPVKILSIPYNNPWSDASRRQYFWEYWYRSAFFGEFDFGDDRKLLASWLLFWSMIVLVIAFAGFIRSLSHRFRDTIPLLLLLVTLVAGHAVFRFRYPFGSSQDFRYSLPILISLAAYATVFVVRCRSELLGNAMRFSIYAFTAFSVAFLLHA